MVVSATACCSAQAERVGRTSATCSSSSSPAATQRRRGSRAPTCTKLRQALGASLAHSSISRSPSVVCSTTCSVRAAYGGNDRQQLGARRGALRPDRRPTRSSAAASGRSRPTQPRNSMRSRSPHLSLRGRLEVVDLQAGRAGQAQGSEGGAVAGGGGRRRRRQPCLLLSTGPGALYTVHRRAASSPATWRLAASSGQPRAIGAGSPLPTAVQRSANAAIFFTEQQAKRGVASDASASSAPCTARCVVLRTKPRPVGSLHLSYNLGDPARRL